MRTVSIRLCDMERTCIPIGFVGENLYTRVRIDSKVVFDEYPTAIASLTVQDPNGTMYPGFISRDGDVIIWDVSASDLVYGGNGALQLAFFVDDVIAKSYICRTYVSKAMIGPGTIPTPIASWIDAANVVLGEAEEVFEALDNMTVAAETLAAGSTATAEISDVDGHKHIDFGIPQGDQGERGETGPAGRDGTDGADGFSPTLVVTTITGGHRITITDKNGSQTVDVLDGEKGDTGATGNGIASVVLNQDYTLTINYTNGQSMTTTSIRGEKGETGATGQTGATGATPIISIGTVTTGAPGSEASATMDTTDPAHPVLSMSIPEGEPGDATIDDTSTAADRVWSAQKTNGLLSAITNILINTLNISQGYYAVADGTKADSPTWCRSALTLSDYSIKTSNSILAALLAYNKNGSYVGAWTGSEFIKEFQYGTLLKSYINVHEVASNYKDYVFVLNFYKGGAYITPSDVADALTFTKMFDPFDVSAKVTSPDVLTFFPVKNGETFTISSLTEGNLPASAKVNLYDANGTYLNYYGTAGAKSRTITASLDFEYVAVVDTLSINMLIQKQEPFGNTSYGKVLNAIGQHQRDINEIQLNVKTYKRDIDEASALIAKYGGDNNTTTCDAHFMWITDIHQETSRMAHFAELVSEMGATMIPFVLNTGDTVSNVMSDGIAWYNTVVTSMSVPVLNMVGNHDAYVTNGVLADDKKDVYDEIISPFVSGWSVVAPEDAAENGYSYYYKELSADIRLIVLDCMYWDATQKTWLDSILTDSLTNEKHVIIGVHAPFASSYCTMVETKWNTGWLSRDSTVTNVEAMESVQSFINDGGIFIAWLQGHVHGDEIVTVDSGRQLAICNNSFSNRGTKVPKINDANAYNYNSYTIVAIDANLHYLKLYRIGADISVSGRKHNGFVWDYENRTVVADW